MPVAGTTQPIVAMTDIWDAVQLIADIPFMGGKTAYAKAYRSSIADIFYWLLRKVNDEDGNPIHQKIEMPKSEILAHLKSELLFHTHQVDAYDGDLKDRAQGQVSAYSKMYDLVHFNL
jgi:hypothetical protein